MVVQTRHIRLYEKRYSVKSEAMSRYCLKMGFRIAKAQIAQYTNVVQGLCGLTSWNNCLVLAFVSSWEVISLQSLNKTLTWCIQYWDIILRIFASCMCDATNDKVAWCTCQIWKDYSMHAFRKQSSEIPHTSSRQSTCSANGIWSKWVC